MNLFQLGNFTLASGLRSSWKIECDALSKGDWEALAAMAIELLPNFARVLGVPKGGLPFAECLEKYATSHPDHPTLIAEDVVTTGGSIKRFSTSMPFEYQQSAIIGVCVFARGECPKWVTPLFQMPLVKRG